MLRWLVRASLTPGSLLLQQPSSQLRRSNLSLSLLLERDEESVVVWYTPLLNTVTLSEPLLVEEWQSCQVHTTKHFVAQFAQFVNM